MNLFIGIRSSVKGGGSCLFFNWLISLEESTIWGFFLKDFGCLFYYLFSTASLISLPRLHMLMFYLVFYMDQHLSSYSSLCIFYSWEKFERIWIGWIWILHVTDDHFLLYYHPNISILPAPFLYAWIYFWQRMYQSSSRCSLGGNLGRIQVLYIVHVQASDLTFYTCHGTAVVCNMLRIS